MKSIKIFTFIFVFALFSDFIYANNIRYNYLHKEKSYKTLLNNRKYKEIVKYKYLAPMFPKELPVEETITIYLNNVFEKNSSKKYENNKLSNNYGYLAPITPTEIPIEEQITIYF